MPVLIPLASVDLGKSVDLGQALPLVLQHCPNAASASVEFWVRQAAIEFCRRTLAYQRELPTFQTEAGKAFYIVSTDANLQVSKLLACRVGARRMELVTNTELDGADAQEAGASGPEAAAMVGTNIMRLYPTPTAEEAVTVRCAMEPTQDAAALPADIFEQHGHAISCGAIKWLAMTPEGRDPVLAQAMAEAFETEIGRAKSRALFNRARSGRRVTPTWC